MTGSAEARRKFIFKKFGRKLGRRIFENAHTRRWLVSPKLNARMRMITVGGKRSKRFVNPIHLTRALCDACFRDKNGNQWKWDKSKSALQTIGSYLRSIRMAENSSRLIDLFLDRERTRTPRLYSYIVAKDSGFAPCVTKSLLTLACCKPKIRSTAKHGDWVMGTTPKKKGSGKLVFLARVSERLTFAEYYRGFAQAYPKREDVIYRPAGQGQYKQLPNSHHGPKQTPKDTGTDSVLLSSEFVYYGGSAIPIADQFQDLVAITQGHKKIRNFQLINQFLGSARQNRWGLQVKSADR